jgi:NADH:ubiquinone oxidoreductase subunit 3 (subunit A)
MILGVIARLFFPWKMMFELAAITYLRLTVVLLLFSIAFYFAHKE